jgi:two-component system, chemotaxis family, CheB/CheR fusion protein
MARLKSPKPATAHFCGARDMTPNDTPDFVIAALGASAGGLEPLETFFKNMPADTGIAFVIVQHLAPDHPTALPQLLGRHTGMPVEQAQNNMKVAPNRVYVIPPNAALTIEKSTLLVTAPPEARGARTPIDGFFSSLAADCGERAVCIMLSGTGTDGTLGLRAIKEYGGMAMAQTLDSAKYDSILRSAIGTGLVDHVLPVEEMPAKLLDYAAHLVSANGNGALDTLRTQIAANMSRIHAILRRRAGHDFSQYKENTIVRRLERRMKALQIETVEQYVQALDRQPEEAERLFNDLLIGVTQFFRDAEAFAALEKEVIPKLFEGKGEGDQVRVCVMGCATGEEAYSIGILLSEYASTLGKGPKIQIFATDIDEGALTLARKGRYPESIAEHVGPERLERFFEKQDRAWQVKRELRDTVLFSSHSFIKDPPFSRLDLISCRNVMIYLGQELQKKLIPLFHYALRPGGYLFLGPSESAGTHKELFAILDKKHRIFERKETLPRPAVAFPLTEISRPNQPAVPSGRKAPEAAEERDLPTRLERIILQRYRPACVTVKENGDAVYFSGRLGRYLDHPTGSPDVNLVSLAREGLRIPLRTALHKAATTRERAIQRQISVQTNGTVSQVDLTVEPIPEFQAANLYMVVFEDVASNTGQPQAAPSVDGSSEETIRHLEDELRSARENAQAMFEELESSNEELKSANEEYQSTNEELETSKEELQSFNEELQTVNTEIGRKSAEVDQANSDLQNLLSSTEIATIFLDADLRIKTFTPAAGAVFRLINGDVGRPITDLAAQFGDVDFVPDIRETLQTLKSRERQLVGTEGRYYQLRVLPYRSVRNVIEGVVLTFTDVTQAKQAAQVIEDEKIYAESIVDTVRIPLLVLDADARVKSANAAFYEMFQLVPAETLNTPVYKLGGGQWDIPLLRRLLVELLPQKHRIEDFEVEHDFPTIGRKIMLLDARQIPQQRDNRPLILLSIEDITARRIAEKKLREVTEFDEAVITNMGEGLYTVDTAGLVTSMNLAAEKLFGWTFEELRGKTMHDVTHRHRPDGTSFPAAECLSLQVLADGKPLVDQEDVFIRKDGTLFDVIYSSAPLKSDSEITGLVVVFRNVTEQRQAAALVTAQRQAFEMFTSGVSLMEVLEVFIRAVEKQTYPGTAVAIHLLDQSGRRFEHTIAPSLSSDYSRATDGMEVSSAIGPCCPAVSSGQRVVVADVAASREFPKFASFVLPLGIRAAWSTPIVDSNGKILGTVAAYYREPRAPKLQDDFFGEIVTRTAAIIIERKKAVDALVRSQEELRSANDDLKHFSYAASHDLQEPLRMVMSYTQLLAREYEGGLGPNADKYIAHAVEGAERMEALLTDLREYWSVNEQRVEKLVPVDCNTIMEKALAYLEMRVRESGAVVTHDPLPIVMAEEVSLTLLFQNLIGNAIKYCRSDESPRIHVSAAQRDGAWNFAVMDNGIGIDAEFLQMIFAPFKRLHGREYPGTGIGLAMCQKIVERYQGRIWAESTAGRGSAFHFTIPKGDAE